MVRDDVAERVQNRVVKPLDEAVAVQVGRLREPILDSLNLAYIWENLCCKLRFVIR